MNRTSTLPPWQAGDWQGRYAAARLLAIIFWVKVRELLKLLDRDGWVLARTRGSHRQYRHPAKPGTVTVAGKPSAEVPPGTLSGALKQAGLKDR